MGVYMIRSFVAGMFAGGLLVAIFRQRLLEFIDAKTRPARFKAADTVGKAAEGLETAKDLIERGLTGEDRDLTGDRPPPAS
jgi:hypothetical protein